MYSIERTNPIWSSVYLESQRDDTTFTGVDLLLELLSPKEFSQDIDFSSKLLWIIESVQLPLTLSHMSLIDTFLYSQPSFSHKRNEKSKNKKILSHKNFEQDKLSNPIRPIHELDVFRVLLKPFNYFSTQDLESVDDTKEQIWLSSLLMLYYALRINLICVTQSKEMLYCLDFVPISVLLSFARINMYRVIIFNVYCSFYCNSTFQQSLHSLLILIFIY